MRHMLVLSLLVVSSCAKPTPVAQIAASAITGTDAAPATRAVRKDKLEISVGMEWRKAEGILKAVKAEEQFLEMMPPKAENGDHMTLRNFKIEDNTVLTIICRNDTVVEITKNMNMNRPKAFRNFERVEIVRLKHR